MRVQPSGKLTRVLVRFFRKAVSHKMKSNSGHFWLECFFRLGTMRKSIMREQAKDSPSKPWRVGPVPQTTHEQRVQAWERYVEAVSCG